MSTLQDKMDLVVYNCQRGVSLAVDHCKVNQDRLLPAIGLSALGLSMLYLRSRKRSHSSNSVPPVLPPRPSAAALPNAQARRSGPKTPVKPRNAEIREAIALVDDEAQVKAKANIITVAASEMKLVQPNHGITIVVQRVNSARLLVNNKDKWDEMERGLILYISFNNAATQKDIKRAIKSLLSVPLLTEGDWGDGSKPESFVKRFERVPGIEFQYNDDGEPQFNWVTGGHSGIMTIPQASLTARIKKTSLQYHNQLDKALGLDMYVNFLVELESFVADLALSKMFRTCPGAQHMYSMYDRKGIPYKRSDGSEIVKKEKKKIDNTYRKAQAWVNEYKSNLKSKWVAEMKRRNGTVDGNTRIAFHARGKSPVDLHAGTFGNRQGLISDATLGPFTHMFQF